MSLINNRDKLKEYLSVENSTDMDSVNPLIDEAEQQYILPAIDQTIYDNLTTGLESDTLTDDEAALLDVVRRALAPLAYFTGLAEINVRMSDLGLHTSQTQEKERIMKWQYDNLSINLQKRGMKALDRLYTYLEKGTAADWYADWTASDAYTKHKSLFVNKASIINQYIELENSRWFFILLRPHLVAAEGFMLQFNIGTEFYFALQARWIANTITDDDKAAIKIIQPCLSYMAYSLALRDMGFIQELIVVKSSNRDQVQAQMNSLGNYEKQSDMYENMATNSLNLLKSYLNSTASSILFPEYFNSDQYEDPATITETNSEIGRRTNNDTSTGTFFM